MQYTDNEAALIGGLISNYFFQPSVEAKCTRWRITKELLNRTAASHQKWWLAAV